LKEGNQTVTNCNQFKLLASDGKMRLTDVADTEQLFRLIQSIPSPKAEPFKQWMATVASERLDLSRQTTIRIHNGYLFGYYIHCDFDIISCQVMNNVYKRAF